MSLLKSSRQIPTFPEAMFTKAVDNFVDNSGVHRRQRATVRLLSQLPCHWAEKFFG
jgi:hypothetical protein